MQHRLVRPGRRLVLSLLFAAGAVIAVGLAWQRYAAPTRVAFVNFPEFQLARIYRARPGPFVQVDVLPLDQLSRARRYPAVLIFGRGLTLTPEQKTALEDAGRTGTRIYVGGATNPEADVTNLRGRDLDFITDYLRFGGARNYARLLAYIRRAIDGKRLFASSIEPPHVIGQDVFFHLDEERVFETFEGFAEWARVAGVHQAGRPRIALVTSVPGPFNANRDHVDALISALEARGYNVFPMAASLRRLEFLRRVQPDLVVFMPHGRLTVDGGDAAVAWLRERNVPVLSPVSVFRAHDEWMTDQQGMDGALLTMSIVLPELDGGIVPYALAAQYRDPEGYLAFQAVPDRLKRFCDIVDRWIALRTKPNREKRVAVFYLKGPGQNALAASHLEVLPSLYHLLRALDAAGYDVSGLPESEAAFAELVRRQGVVLGPYARGALDAFLETGDPALVPREEYETWTAEELPRDLYADVLKIYGPPPGDYMAVTRDGRDALAVARVRFGNVVVLPQPLPGYGDDTFALVHGTRKAPPHPYIAAYLWARRGFGADAILHLGTHGSLEFTPSKQVALSALDWPDALIGPVPHFYVYITSNVGEGIIAKRRSYATTITHLTPPFREGGVYSGLAQLRDLVARYATAPDGSVKGEYARRVAALAAATGVHTDLDLPPDWRSWTEQDLLRLSNHVENLAHEKVTAGLYTWGRGYGSEAIRSTSLLMALDPVAYAMARLDLEEGRIDQGRLDDAVFFDRRYRQRARALIERVLDGADADSVLADIVAPSRVAAAREWAKRSRSLPDAAVAGGAVDPAGPSRGFPAGREEDRIRQDPGTLRALLVRVLSDAARREFLDRLRSEKEFTQASNLLDPAIRERAATVARAVPQVARALEITADADVQTLLRVMQDEATRAAVFRLMNDPSLEARVIEERKALDEAVARAALEPGRVRWLRDGLAGDLETRLADMPDAALAALVDALRWYAAHADRAAAIARIDDASAREVSAMLTNARFTERASALIAAAEDEQARRARREAELQRAILTLADTLAMATRYRDRLAESPKREVAGVINALAGGYIEPQPGGDPVGSPAAVPSGRNLYSIDAERTPSAQAWEVGVALGRSLLARHLAQHGEYPRKVAFTLWPGDFIQTEGATLAQILYLLGVEPVRDPFGRVVDVRVVPADRLGRPRIDVVVQTAGQLRDIAASRLYLINRAVRLVAALDEPGAENRVKMGAARAEALLKERGLSPAEARTFSTLRVFGGVDGSYGTGIMALVESGDRWDSAGEVATRYLANMGAAYDEGPLWGAFRDGVFEAALQDAEIVVHPRESYTWGPLSLDHVYEFMGGLSLAVRHVTGRDPDAYFNDLRNAHRPLVTGLVESIWTEARSTLLNPAYIRDLATGGASSAEKLAETFRNTYGWSAMRPAAIDSSLWDRLYATYIEDVHGLGVRGFFARENPYALQEITAVMLETARKGYWSATDEQLRTLASLHAALVNEHAPGCSGFVCDNPTLRAMIAGLVEGTTATEYEQQLARVREGPPGRADAVVLERQPQVLQPRAAPFDGSVDARFLPAAAAVALLLAAWLVQQRRRKAGTR